MAGIDCPSCTVMVWGSDGDTSKVPTSPESPPLLLEALPSLQAKMPQGEEEASFPPSSSDPSTSAGPPSPPSPLANCELWLVPQPPPAVATARDKKRRYERPLANA